MIGSQQISRIVLTCLLCVTTAVAQDTDSHRSLQRPGMDMRGVQLRLELLQRLQQIARDRQERGQPPLDLKKLSKQVREKLDQVQNQDKQLRDRLEQAQRNRENANPASPENLAKDIDKTIQDIDRLRRRNQTQRNSQPRRDPTSPAEPPRDSRPRSQPNTNRPNTNQRSPNNRQNSAPRGNGGDQPTGRSNQQNLQERLTEQQLNQARKQVERLRRDLEDQPNPRRHHVIREELDSVRRKLPDQPSPDGDSDAEADKLFRDFVKKQQQRRPEYRSPRDQSSADRRSPNNNSGETDNPSQRQLSPKDFDGLNIEEYLKRLEKMSPPSSRSGDQTPRSRNQQNRNRNSNNRPPNGSNNAERGSNRNPPRSRSDNQSQEKRAPSRKDWKKWLEDAKKGRVGTNGEPAGRESRGDRQQDSTAPPGSSNNDSNNSTTPDSSGGSGKGFFSGAIRRTAESMFDQVGESIQNNKGRSRGRSTRNFPRGSNKPSGGFMDSMRQAGRRTGEIFGNASNTVDSIGGGSGGGGVSMPAGPDLQSLAPFLLIAVLVAAAWFALKHFESNQLETVPVANVPTALPTKVNTRQDVIDAFHYIASRTPSVRGNWWTHSRVAKALRKLWPGRTDAIGDLKRVYETARYLPPDAQLTAEQIQAARSAIERCSE